MAERGHVDDPFDIEDIKKAVRGKTSYWIDEKGAECTVYNRMDSVWRL